MITMKNYVKARSLEEAFQLNQAKRNCVIGGMLWVRTGKRSVDTVIDLSGLGLDTIEETEDSFKIGAMVTLRQLETSEELGSFFGGSIRKAVENIVGVQFRNLATVGGSIWGRYGFSDVLTVFLSMDSCVELYQGGRIPLEDFINRPKDNDILMSIIVKKIPGFYSYESIRIQSADFPVLTCAVSGYGGDWYAAVGARPGKAVKIRDAEHILKEDITKASLTKEDTAKENTAKASLTKEDIVKERLTKEDIAKERMQGFASYIAEHTVTGTNIRGGKEYRKQLVRVLCERCLTGSGEKK